MKTTDKLHKVEEKFENRMTNCCVKCLPPFIEILHGNMHFDVIAIAIGLNPGNPDKRHNQINQQIMCETQQATQSRGFYHF